MRVPSRIAIAEALKVTAVLTELWLGGNKIGDVGANAIAEALKVIAVLTALWLGRNNLGEAGKTAVQDAVKGRSGFTLMSSWWYEAALEAAQAAQAAQEAFRMWARLG